MQGPIKIQVEGKHLNIWFSYNEDLVEIMKELNGWYISKTQMWMFPAYRLSEIRDLLISKKYRVTIVSEKGPERSTAKVPSIDDRFKKNPNIVAIMGKCKSCGYTLFIDRQHSCTECSLSKKRKS